jgi:hypothetical protein
MVFVRAKDGISHSAKEWSSNEDRMEGALALGKAVMNDDEVLQVKSGKVRNNCNLGYDDGYVHDECCRVATRLRFAAPRES